jgi:hypothetical protein
MTGQQYDFDDIRRMMDLLTTIRGNLRVYIAGATVNNNDCSEQIELLNKFNFITSDTTIGEIVAFCQKQIKPE